MPTIRKQFHDIANCHNIILVTASCTKELLKEVPITTLNPEELKTQQEKLIKAFDELEEAITAADEKTKVLKDFVYSNINPDSELTTPK